MEQAARALAAMQAALRVRGEPSRWATLQWAASAALSGRVAPENDEVLPPTLRAIEAAAAQPGVFTRLGAQAGDDLMTGLWWLSDAALANSPLSERVEAEVHSRLSDGAPVDLRDLLPAVYAAFPGAQTPGQGLVLAVLASYARKLESGLWQLRPEDAPTARAEDLKATVAHLRAIAGRSGLAVAGERPMQWREGDRPLYAFAVLTTAGLAATLLAPPPPAERQRFLVLPGGRVALAEYTLRRDPRLRAAFEAGGWSIIKYRHVRRMAADAAVTRATLEPALSGDPVEAAQQLALPE